MKSDIGLSEKIQFPAHSSSCVFVRPGSLRLLHLWADEKEDRPVGIRKSEELVTQLADLTSFLSHITSADAFRTSYLIVDDVLAAQK
jgi:hypothetical protein